MGERLSLEPAAVAVCEDNSAHPRSYELIPDAGRQLLSDFQDRPIAKDEVTIEDEPCDTGDWGIINVRYIRPIGAFGRLPVIFYIHGGGWVFGDSHTHDKLIRELAVRTHSVVISQNIHWRLRPSILRRLNRITLSFAKRRPLTVCGMPVT